MSCKAINNYIHDPLIEFLPKLAWRDMIVLWWCWSLHLCKLVLSLMLSVKRAPVPGVSLPQDSLI